jgi:PPOX class probable F420-dependent enzyme
MLDLDTTTEFGRRVQRRLQEERIIWLTTVASDQTPQPRPVWFLWDGQTFLIFSRPDTHKLRHIANNPNVALNFDGDELGGDIVVFTGEAQVAEDVPPADEIPDYVDKYEDGMERIGMTPSEFAQSFSVPVRITPQSLRGH